MLVGIFEGGGGGVLGIYCRTGLTAPKNLGINI